MDLLKKFDSKTEALAYERYAKSLEGGVQLKETIRPLGIIDQPGKLSVGG